MENRLKISKRTEYGIRAIIQLARAWPAHFMLSKDIARQERLPTKFLESILLALRRGGFLESKVGMGGGYRLTRHPRDINVSDLIRRLEGRPIVPEPTGREPATPGSIGVSIISQRLTGAISDALHELTLEQLIEQIARESRSGEEMYYI